jgi:hypothetical protein
MALHTPACLAKSFRSLWFAHRKAGLMLVVAVAFIVPAFLCCSSNGKARDGQVAYVYNVGRPNSGEHPPFVKRE